MTEASNLSAAEFRETFGALGIAQGRVAQLFGVDPRNVRRWAHGDRRIPRGVGIVLRLLAARAVTVDQVEQAAAPAPARTNGGAKSEPSVPLLVEPVPERTTAEKVYALTPESCRWPCGDPGHPDFRFCGDLVAKRPYCEHHRTMAYMVPRTGGGHGARIRLVAQWDHQPSFLKGVHHAAALVA